MKDRILVEVDRKLVGVDRRLVVMDKGLVLMDWRNVGVDKLIVEDRLVVDGGVGKGLLNQEPDKQDRTLSHPTYLKINVKLNTINIHISHYLGSPSTISPLARARISEEQLLHYQHHRQHHHQQYH